MSSFLAISFEDKGLDSMEPEAHEEGSEDPTSGISDPQTLRLTADVAVKA
jgi:hypothetical protein